MYKIRLSLALSLFLSINSLHAQEHTEESLHKNDNGIYIGHVNGMLADEFIKLSTRDTLFGLTHLTKSKNVIEIRFFESPSMSNSACTILYYDTAFNLERRYQIPLHSDTVSDRISKESQPLALMNPDTVFHKLVRTGIFSYTPENTRVSRKVLTKNGIEEYRMLCITSDGTSYSLHIKIGNLYRRLFFRSSADFNHKCYPEFWDFRRQSEVIELFKAGLFSVKKQ